VNVGAGRQQYVDSSALPLVDGVEQGRPVIAAGIDVVDVVPGGGE